MTVSNIGIASVLTDLFGKTTTEIIPCLLEHTFDSMDEKAVHKYIKKKTNVKSNEIIAVIKSKKQQYFAIKYGEIKKRHGHKKAVITIARMMLVIIYHMISEKKPFEPTDYEKLMDSHNNKERVVLNKSNIFAYLETFGYDSSTLVKRNDN